VVDGVAETDGVVDGVGDIDGVGEGVGGAPCADKASAATIAPTTQRVYRPWAAKNQNIGAISLGSK